MLLRQSGSECQLNHSCSQWSTPPEPLRVSAQPELPSLFTQPELLSVSTQPELRYASISNTLDLVLESLSVKRMFKVDFVPGQI